MPHCVWLIGGTGESAELAIALAQLALPCIVTVTTESARSLYPESPHLFVWVGRLTPEQIPSFLTNYQISSILDASHPFAVEVSQMAIAVAQQFNLPYLRYERPALLGEQHENVVYFPSFAVLLDSNLLQHERVLLTIGYRFLQAFQPWHDRATLFARILPSAVALDAALTAGFTSDRLIALRPPISVELERALWQHWHISMVVTKASGSGGGEDVKRSLANELGVKLVIIDRPVILYPNQTSDLQTALQFCQQPTPPDPLPQSILIDVGPDEDDPSTNEALR